MRNQSGCTTAIIVVAVLFFIGLGVWWIEDRFSSTAAIMVIGGLSGVICLVIGYILSMANTRSTLKAASDFNRDVASVEKVRQQSFREFMRGDTVQRSANARLQVLDAKRIDQLAQQRANLFLDLERQKLQDEKRTPLWGIDDDDNGDATYLE